MGRPGIDITIAVFGKSGVGKSALCNCLLKKSKSSKIFESRCSFTSVTLKTEFAFCKYNERLVYVFDTPGEIGPSNPKIIDFLLECVISSPTGFDCLIVAFETGRGPNDMSFIKDLEARFGDMNFYENVIVVFTKTDHIDEKEGETFEKFLETLDDDMKNFVDKCGGCDHVLPFNKNLEEKEYFKQADRIIGAVLNKKVGPVKLSNFEKSYKVVEKELENIDKRNKVEEKESFGATSRSLNNSRIDLFRNPSQELRSAVEMDLKGSVQFFKYRQEETK